VHGSWNASRSISIDAGRQSSRIGEWKWQPSNVSLQLTADSLKEVVVVARLAGIVRRLHLPGRDVARS
jgi:hypothetical protein